MNPYQNLSDYNFWSRSISNIHPSRLDPCTSGRLIEPGEKVSTLGSCFAQHISKRISESGLNYYVPEAAPVGMSKEQANQKNYGVFSARYGNLYTVKQMLQLFYRAYGLFQPSEIFWMKEGNFVDPFRPLIEPDGFSSEQLLINSRSDHFQAVREICENSDWMVLTLGLTEAWQNTSDGAIYPIAPGVSGGNWNEILYNFKNFNFSEVISDLLELMNFIRSKNPRVKFLLTVSPVPLIATYENRHVLESTVYSKSVLRVACEEVLRLVFDTYYFPSYELITSSAVSGRYFRDDLREVTPMGVSHVMRVFEKHYIYVDSKDVHSVKVDMQDTAKSICSEIGVVCDEEVIERSLRVIT
jgi:hypothetical protein